MPTGYTHKVQEGTITEFKDFALSCARAFGALITMRDDPMDATIPDVIEPDGYYAECVAERKSEFERLQSMSVDQQTLAYIADKKHDEDYRQQRIERNKSERQRYEAMLAKVRSEDGFGKARKDHGRLIAAAIRARKG